MTNRLAARNVRPSSFGACMAHKLLDAVVNLGAAILGQAARRCSKRLCVCSTSAPAGCGAILWSCASGTFWTRPGNRDGATRKSLPAKKTPLNVASLARAYTKAAIDCLSAAVTSPPAGHAALHANPSCANPARQRLGQAASDGERRSGWRNRSHHPKIFRWKKERLICRTTAGSRAPHQLKLWEFLAFGGKRAMAVWHRRAGKDEVCLHHTASAAMERVGNYWHCLPEFSQARKAIWTAVNAHTGKRRIDEIFPHELRVSTNDNEMFIRLANGSTWQCVGSDAVTTGSGIGSSTAGIVFSEYALANPSAWAYYRPISGGKPRLGGVHHYSQRTQSCTCPVPVCFSVSRLVLRTPHSARYRRSHRRNSCRNHEGVLLAFRQRSGTGDVRSGATLFLECIRAGSVLCGRMRSGAARGAHHGV